jgi:cytochrome oxidase Cu insertion factor (SCO1/SenC/PrrC family)
MFTSNQARLALVALLTLAAATARAQQTVAPAADATPEVGAVAPDFALSGATRYGVLRDSVRLSDFRGKTVVLAFFYRARSKG